MGEKPDSAEPRRRWYQFSLRTLLIGVALVGTACGYFAHEARIVTERKAWRRENPCDYSILFSEPRIVAVRNAAADPSLLRRWLGDEAATEIMIYRTDAQADAAKGQFPEASIASWGE